MKQKNRFVSKFVKISLLVMLVMLACGCLFTALAQDKRITMNVQKQTLNSVIETLADRFSYKFAFDAGQFKKIEVSINLQNVSITDFLKLLAQKYSVMNSFLNDTYVLYLVASPPVVAEKRKIIVSGKATDKQTGESLIYCNILFDEMKGTSTNDLGYFSYQVDQPGEIKIAVSHLGYHRLDTIVKVTNDFFINLKLQAFSMIMEEIKVLSMEKNMLEMTAQPDLVAFNPKQSANIPRIDESDLVNALTMIPGITFLGGQQCGLSIRGGSPSENLILVDGIPVLETNHLFGNISVLNAKFVKQAFVSRGGFDVRYGGRVSGIVDLTGKSGKRGQAEADLTANLMNGNFFAAIPLGKKVSLSGAYRRSYIYQWQNYLVKSLQELSTTENTSDNNSYALNPVITFEDANAKLSIRPNDKHEINLNFFMANESQQKDYQFNNERFFRFDNADGKNTGASANWIIQSGKWMNKFSFSFTRLERNSLNESGKTIVDNSNNGKGKNKPQPNKLDKYEAESDYNDVGEQRVEWQSEFKHGMFQHQFGTGYTSHAIDYRFSAQKTTGNIPVDSISETREAKIIHGYYQQQLSVSEKIKVRAGVRLDYGTGSQRMVWQPRGGVYIYPSKGLECYYLAGKYSQTLTRIRKTDVFGNSDLAWYLPDESGTGMLSSIHHVAGIRFEKRKLLVNLELYQKNTDGKTNLFSELYRKMSEQRIRYTLYSGDEINRGLDFFVQYRTGNWTQMAGYTLSKSDERYEGYNSGDYFPSFDDQRHRLRLIEMYQYRSWTASASWIYNTGSPVQSDLNGSSVTFSSLPYFSQLDLALVKRFKYKTFSVDAGVSLLNVLNRKNVIGTDSFTLTDTSGQTTVKSELTGLSFTPVFYLSLRLN